MDVHTIISYIVLVTGCLWIIYQLWTFSLFGKLIVQANRSLGLTILWVIFLIIWVLSALLNKKTVNNILFALDILGVMISIVAIVRSLMDKEIRENGILCNSHFYKWSQIKGYRWISEKIIKFNTEATLTSGGGFELIVKKELKSKADEALQKYITL